MARGGKRAGAGRPVGARNKLVLQFRSKWTEKDMDNFVDLVKDRMYKSDKVLTWVGDQLLGKAIQQVDGQLNGSLTLQVVKYGDDYTPPIPAKGVSTKGSE